jgi:hypothetical protein
MRWALIQATNQFHYWKLEQDDSSSDLKYNANALSFRLNAGDKRLFFIEKAGFLQNKFLIRTEYSVVTGEILPMKNWRSGIVVLENKKYNFSLQENSIILSSKKEGILSPIEITETQSLTPPEFYALLFGALRVIAKTLKSKEALVLS